MPGSTVLTFSPDPSIAFFLKGVLDCVGFSVTAIVARPDDVLAAVNRIRPDVIIYDVRQPVVEACGALRRLRRRRHARDIPMVITTSDARALREVTRVGTAVELAGIPDDVKRVREAVDRAVSARSGRPAA